jgi:hypothetical protein
MIRTLAIVVIFLAQALLLPYMTEAGGFSLAPPSVINLPDFNQLLTAVRTGVAIYRLDAMGECPKADLKAKCEAITAANPLPSFDISKMDLGKKGWTRYYSFSIGNRDLIIRIFLTGEYEYQITIPDEDIILQASRKDIGITYQVFTGVNAILKNSRIKPHAPFDPKRTGSSL